MKSIINSSIILVVGVLLAIGLYFRVYAQTTAYALSPAPKLQFLDNNGHPYSGGKLYVCVSGATCPGTPLDTYIDVNGTRNTNPIVLDSAGRATIYLNTSVTYQYVLKDQFGNTVLTQDPVNSAGGVSASAVATTGSVVPSSCTTPGMFFILNVINQLWVCNGSIYVISPVVPAYGTTIPGTCAPEASLFVNINTGIIYVCHGGFYVSGNFGECFNLLNYGGDRSGSTNNDAAFSTVIGLNPYKACVYLPGPGTYNFANAAQWAANSSSFNNSLTVKGDGNNTSVIFATGGFLFYSFHGGDSVTVKDMDIQTRQANISNGIALINAGIQNGFAMSSISNINLYGADGYAAADYWSSGIAIGSWSNVSVRDVNIIGSATGGGTGGLGQALYLFTLAGINGVTYNIDNLNNSYGHIGVLMTDLIQGVHVSKSHFTAVDTGVSVPTGIPYGHLDELVISDSDFNCQSIAIDIESPLRHTNVHDNYIIVPGPTNGMMFNNYAMTNVSNNQLLNIGAAGGNGIVFAQYSNDASQVLFNQTQGFVTGIWLQTVSAHTSAFFNIGTGDTTELLNTGTANASTVTFIGTPTSTFQTDHGAVIHQ